MSLSIFLQKIPLQYKLANLDEVVRINENALGNKATQYYQKTPRNGKRILREVMSKFIPAGYERVKQGFSAAKCPWFQEQCRIFEKHYFHNNAHIYDYFEHKTVRMLANEHFEG